MQAVVSVRVVRISGFIRRTTAGDTTAAHSPFALLERFDLVSASSLPIALQRRQIYFGLLHSQFSPTSISTQLRADSIRPSHHLPIYITILVSCCIPHRLDEMHDHRNFHHPVDKAKAGEASVNVQSLEGRLADLKEQFRNASTTYSSADASPVNPHEVRVSLIASDRSLNFPFRTHSQIVPYPIQPRG